MSSRRDNVTNLKGGRGTEVPPPPDVTGTGQGVMFGDYGPLDTPEVREAIRREYAAIAKLENERSNLNAKIKAHREGLVQRGLNRKAIQDGVKIAKLNEADRIDYDRSYMIARKAQNADMVIHPAAVDEDDELGDDEANIEPPAH